LDSDITRGTGSFIAILDDGIARLFDFDHDRPVEIAHYGEKPWFSDAVRLGGLIVTVGTDRRTLEMYRFGEATTL